MIFEKLIFWFKKRNRIIYLTYSALALIVLLPLLRSGYVFAMDMVFVPHLTWPEPFNAPGFFLYLLNFILPSQIIQKIILFLILFLSGVGMHRLIPVKSELPKYFAGVFYIFNPFVYSRFLFGHLWLLAVYALMPFAVKAIFTFLDNINLRNALKLSLWFTFIGFISNHFIVFAFLFFIIAFLFELWKERRYRKEIFKMFKYAILVGLIFLILSGWWIAPYFDKTLPQGRYIQEIVGTGDLTVFQTESDTKYGVLCNVAALYGFWGDRMGQYTVPKEIMPHWPLLFLIIFSLVTLGAISAFRKNKFKAGIFIIIAGVAFVLSVGMSYQFFAPIIEFLNEKIFIFKGFRDSQKFTALLVLTYAYFGALGINSILKSSKLKVQSSKLILTAFLIALPVLYSPLMIWGFRGQLCASHYPQDWFATNEFLNQDKEDFKVLFFPWHQYMSFGFTKNRVIASPAPKFFDKQVIAGDNMEIGKIYTHSQRPISQFIENQVLAKRQEIDNLGEILASYNLKYIILAKEADWQEYDFLNVQKDLEIINDYENLIIYQNKVWE
ncbi:hypothetical protein KAS79_02060 [Candidatus Parcubacteria bacterium]|nr:hypothetical protein [Candidatus Parcubacteria bacterium]